MTVAHARARAHHTNAVQGGGGRAYTLRAATTRARVRAHTHRQVVNAHTCRARVWAAAGNTYTTLRTHGALSLRGAATSKGDGGCAEQAPPPPPPSLKRVCTSSPAQRESGPRCNTKLAVVGGGRSREGSDKKNKFRRACSVFCVSVRAPAATEAGRLRRLFEECGCCCCVRVLCV